MRQRISLCLFIVAIMAFSVTLFAQSSTENGGWPDPNFKPDPNAPHGPAPKHDISGMWGVLGGQAGIQAGGVQAEPNDGKPEHQLPYTPYGLKVYKEHKPLEGFDAVPPGQYNDPREICEPLGFPAPIITNSGLSRFFRTLIRWRFCINTTIAGGSSGRTGERCRRWLMAA